MTCQPVKSSVTAFLVLQLSFTPSWADATRQGDHVLVSHRDVALTVHQHTLAFERTYNAQSAHSGWVGTGWGSVYETYVSAGTDGTFVVHENGNGPQHVYRRPRPDEAPSGWILALPTRTLLQDPRCASGYLQVTARGYRRGSCSGHEDFFDQQGRLLSREAWDGYKFEVIYEADQATRIQDSLGQTLTLHWSEAGKLTQVSDPAGTGVSYEHDGAGNLLKFTDTTGRLIQYAYGDQRKLTQRSHPDDRHQQVAISPAHHGWSPLSCLWRDPSESLRVDDTR